MNLTSLTAISPVDGRYNRVTAPLSTWFSEFALIRYRVWIEVEYFIALCAIPLPQLSAFETKHFPVLRSWYETFTEADALAIKNIEKTTNHDVKAVEYFLKEKFISLGLEKYSEFIHFGLTSQDINNTAVPLSLKHALEENLLPQLHALIGELDELATSWEHIPMLAHTHGQPASPTRLGKEIRVFVERLQNQAEMLQNVPIAAKFGGATGNFNAHHVAFPNIDWQQFGNQFVSQTLGLHRYQFTTQIEHYDYLAALLDAQKRINNILLDLCRDFWTYISMNYFRQQIKAGEVGSSAMPHKVNPIDFENAEGNLGVANALLEHLSAKLPVSRLQRDLTDSTVLRNLGVPFAHTLIAYTSTTKGLKKLLVDEKSIRADLDANWAVVAEAIQTILRREGYEKPYEALKELTRTNSTITAESIYAFIEGLHVSFGVKAELHDISPWNYTGI
jgi:adenylosuccinate lyase